MRTNFRQLLPLLAIFASAIIAGAFAGCSDYPPIDSSFSFNITRSVTFSLSNAATLNIDTSLSASAAIDTNAYVDSESAAYLITEAQVGSISIQLSDPNYTLDELGPIAVLIGTDTVATDTLPQGTIDTTLTLTHADISKYMRDTSFTATLDCKLQRARESPISLSCNMTIIYAATVRP